MAIKAGQVLHDANGFVVDRIQTGGVSSLNIPQEKIYELGNYQAVATIRDVADLSFDVQSFDVSTEVEALSVGLDPTTVNTGDGIDFNNSIPMDVVSPFKAGGTSFAIVQGVVIPYLTLDTVTYRFGVRQNSTQQFTFKGDSVYYVPGSPYFQDVTLIDNTLTYNFAHTALKYVESGDNIYALSACVKNPTTHISKRLFLGEHFTNNTTSITLLADYFDQGYTHLHVTFGSATAATFPQNVHEGISVKPAAVRGKDIDVYITDPTLATPALARWTGVQSFEAARKVNLQADEELGNTHYISQDYDVPDVSGNIVFKPTDTNDLFEKLRQIANISGTTDIIGPYSSIPLAMELRVNDPDTGVRLKTIYIADARFTIPPLQGQVQQKVQLTIPWSSDGGQMVVYRGAKP